jgi:M61 glycyl aminopeptidase
MNGTTVHHVMDARKLVLLVLGLGYWALAAASNDTVHYTVTASDRLEFFAVHACFTGQLPTTLTLNHGLVPTRVTGLKALTRDVDVFRFTPERVTGQCADYIVDLSDLRGDPHADVMRLPDAILLDPSWLLALPAGKTRLMLDVEMRLPAGFSVGVPALVTTQSPHTARFQIATRAWTRGGRLAIGEVSRHSLRLGTTSLAIDIVGKQTPAAQQRYVAWIDQTSKALAGLYGRLPIPWVQVMIIPQPPGPEVVPWGEVTRLGADSVVLFVDQSRALDALTMDWVAIHEFSHLLHPFLQRRDSWLTEGLASYYQNVLRAQAGTVTPSDAWRALAAGFARGRRQTDGRTSLAAATEQMLDRRLFMRVYWSGAALALLADVELRQRTQQRMSLARVLAEFASCCLPAAEPWTARAVLREFDKIAGLAVFERLVDQYLETTEFPSLASAYVALGIIEHRGKLNFSTHPAARRLRESIMGDRVSKDSDAVARAEH